MTRRQIKLYAKYPHMEPTGPRTVTRRVTADEAKRLAAKYETTAKFIKKTFLTEIRWGTPWYSDGDPYANTTQ